MGKYAVTGAASGIGQAVANQLKNAGHDVITVDIRNADITADLSDSAQVDSAVRDIQALAQDGLHGFVPCAGLGPEFPEKQNIPLVNFFCVIHMVQALRESLKKQGGAVVLISSNSAQMTQYDQGYVDALLNENKPAVVEMAPGLDGQTLYGGGKHALTRWMRRMNQGFAGDGIRMNAVAPGFTETGMTKAGLEDPKFGSAIRDFAASIPIGRPGLPQDQSDAICFLLSDKAGFVSGSVLFVDGGHDAVFRPDSF